MDENELDESCLDLDRLALVRPVAEECWAEARNERCSPSFAQRFKGAVAGTVFTSHPFWELTVALAGSGTMELRDRRIPLRAGSAVLVPPHVAHRERRGRHCDTVWIGLRGHDAGLGAGLAVVHGDAGLGAIALRVWQLAQRAAVVGPELDALTGALVAAMRRQSHGEAADLVDFAIERLGADLAGEHAVAAVAAELQCSPSWLHRSFRERTGETPVAYRNRLRIERLLQVLAETQLSIADAAHEAGFSDPLYASRLCRQRTGHPPSWWRQRLRGVSA
ncbi:MAG: AraC family transcriptional regulator [Planctomycetota bacterium]|jgi:AraC-like DNA-binding protein|nr:AraC family transcriptional regulator [Planctomycetota bacterium]